jgi:hypothetical protein
LKGEKTMLFAKNKPTKKIHFGDDFIELRHLSKGELNDYQIQLAELSAKVSTIEKGTMEKMQNGDLSGIPDNVGSIVKQIKELEYSKVKSAIKSWTAKEEITLASVRELDEPVFDEVSKAVDEMNTLTDLERKN